MGTYKHLFNNIDERYNIIFNNEQVIEFIDFVIKNDLTFGGKGYNSNNQILLAFTINDNDGSYITFNDEYYEKDKYK